MPKTSNKNKGSKADSSEKIVQFTQCQLENLIETMISKATKPLEERIKKLELEAVQLRESQNFILKKHDDLTEDCDSLKRSNKQQTKDLRQLTKTTDTLQKSKFKDQLRIDEIEQYNRRQNLELQGVPVRKNDDVTQITLDLISKLDVDIKEEDISIAHRLPVKQRYGRTRLNKPVNHPTITVRLVSRQMRNEIYDKRFNAKMIEDFPVEGMKKLFINKNLTQRSKRLFWLSKQKAKELEYKYFWTQNGQIFFRKNEESKKVLIRSESDLDQLQ